LGIAVVLLGRGAGHDTADSLASDLALARAMSPAAFLSSPSDALLEKTRFRIPDLLPASGFTDPFKETFL
jgi:hypothetical protein